jgi:hypothetical protein
MSAGQDRPRLGELLLASGAITAAQLKVALRDQGAWGGRLGQSLLDMGAIDEATLAATVAKQLGLQQVDLDAVELRPEVTTLLPVGIVERYGVVPLAASPGEGRLAVACFDPTNNAGLLAVRAATGLVPEPRVATASAVDRAIRRAYYGEADPRSPADPGLDVTRNVMEQRPEGGEALAERLDELERRLERLERLLAATFASPERPLP